MVKKAVPRKVKALLQRYMLLLNERRMSEAEKVLQQIKERLKTSPWDKGFFNALEGIFAAFRAKDNPYFYATQIDPSDTKKLRQLRKEFLEESTNPLQNEFDQGFFSAWAEYVKDLKRLKKQSLKEYIPDGT
jgi:hypothetical protein